MSTVLRANRLADGKVISEEIDYFTLYKHLEKIDRICAELRLVPVSAFCDTTDFRFNNEGHSLEPGEESTTEVMAREGLWLDAREAYRTLSVLADHIRRSETRFGFLGRDTRGVIAELRSGAGFAESSARRGQLFNLCVVA